MLIKPPAIGLLALLAPLVTAVGKARVMNDCPFNITLWSVDSQIHGPVTIQPRGGRYKEPFRHDPKTGGVAIKITREADGLFTGAPQLNFAYTLDGDKVFYDLSNVFGAPFEEKKLVELSAERSCPVIQWDNGTPPAGSQVRDCTSAEDVVLILCAKK
jgi:Blastomyces yeast-phase-specific protein